MALRQLRGGDYRSLLAKAAGGDQAVTGASVTLVYTSTYWRNAWKYQARTYRHCFWDSGTILANTLAVATALSLPARIVLGFLDDEVNLLLDLDSEREVALSLVALGFSPTRPADPARTMERLNLATAPLSAAEVDYPVIRAMHSASSLTTPDEVAVWRDPSKLTPQPAPAGKLVPLSIPPQEELPRDPIEKVIARRGSSRHFGATPISFEALSTILEVATRRIPADFLNPSTAWLNDTYLVVNAVDGLTSGAYLFRRQQKTLELLRAGDFRQEAGHLDLGQALAADAAVNVYFLADLGSALERLGNRGYRAAQLEASITAGKMYLASYALGLSATGLTFFDDDVTNFFSPHAQGKSVMFLIALGMPGRGSSSPNH
jgi:nitroreductase